MPRKKQNNIEPQILQPIDEPIPESMETKPVRLPKSERILPDTMNLQPEKPPRVHVSGFLLLFLAVGVAGAAVYYWPGYGMRDFMSADAQSFTPAVNHKIASPTPTNTPAEKIFTNDTYSFQITYPGTYVVDGDFEKDKSVTILETANAETGINLSFVAKPIASARGDIAGSYTVVSAKDTKFNGYDAREILVGVEGVGPSRIILISRPGGTFKIVTPASLYEDILATFKFTK